MKFLSRAAIWPESRGKTEISLMAQLQQRQTTTNKYTKRRDDSDISTDESVKGSPMANYDIRKAKLSELTAIRWLLIVLNVFVLLGFAAIVAIVAVFWSMSGVMTETIGHIQSITSRVNAATASPALTKTITNLLNISDRLPLSFQDATTFLARANVSNLLNVATRTLGSVVNATDLFALENMTAVLHVARRVVSFVNRTSSVIETLSTEVDALSIVHFANNQHLLLHTARIITTVIDLLNRLEKPDARASLTAMMTDGTQLVTQMRLLIDEMHNTGVVLRV